MCGLWTNMTTNRAIAITAFLPLFLAASIEAFAIASTRACSRPRTYGEGGILVGRPREEGGGGTPDGTEDFSSYAADDDPGE